MEVFEPYLVKIEDESHREKVESLLKWISEEFPQLNGQIKWNQPMFTIHGTFIIGLSTASKHFSIAPEQYTIEHFSEDILKANYTHGKNLFRILWTDEIDYDLLRKIIDFNIEDKKDYDKFWR